MAPRAAYGCSAVRGDDVDVAVRPAGDGTDAVRGGVSPRTPQQTGLVDPAVPDVHPRFLVGVQEHAGSADFAACARERYVSMLTRRVPLVMVHPSRPRCDAFASSRFSSSKSSAVTSATGSATARDRRSHVRTCPLIRSRASPRPTVGSIRCCPYERTSQRASRHGAEAQPGTPDRCP